MIDEGILESCDVATRIEGSLNVGCWIDCRSTERRCVGNRGTICGCGRTIDGSYEVGQIETGVALNIVGKGGLCGDDCISCACLCLVTDRVAYIGRTGP